MSLYGNAARTPRGTHTCDLQQVPELPLSLDLHLHHRVVCVLDALQSFLNARKQVDDLLFADQDFTVGRRRVFKHSTHTLTGTTHRCVGP